ncbi:MAG TPA: hypothetical protein VH331_05835 [Allosphingosinicella sp.]|nr:hypothetical protein [Allosphingosinicella sp.]
MNHLAASLFFIGALLAAAVTIHMTVRAYWAEILLALKGEWNGVGGFRPQAARPRARDFAPQPRRAAF